MPTLAELRITRVVSLQPPLRTGGALRAAAVLTWVAAGTVVVASLLGLFVTDLYPEEEWAVAALRGNDLVTLLLVAPVLVAAPVLARRGQVPWILLWLGALLYGTYNFAYYVFGTAFNDVFLLHVASFSASLLAMVFLAASIDERAVARGVTWGRSTRVVAGFMLFVGAALVAAWGGLSLRFAVNGTLPDSFMPPEAVHLVYALDLSLLAPTFLLGGILLWRATSWGYVAGVAVNAFGAAYLVVLEVVNGFQANAGIGETTWLSWPSIVGALLCGAAVAVLLRSRADI